MNWDKININSVLEVLRHIESNTFNLDSDCSIVYSDGKEELKISYKKIEGKEWKKKLNLN